MPSTSALADSVIDAGPRLGTCRLSYRVSKCFQIIRLWNRYRELAAVSYDLPAPGDGESQRVLLAQVVGMRLSESG